MAVKIAISITQNSQSIANNTSNVTVKVTASWTYGSHNHLEKSGWLKIDGTTYNFTSPFNTGETTSGTTTLYSKTVNIAHNSEGVKTLSCSASYTSGVSSGTVTASTSKTLTTIPRKSTLSVSNGTLGTSQTLTVTKKASSFTHTITYTCGSSSGTVCTKSDNTSVSWNPPLSLASQNTTGTSVSVKLTITTYSGSTNVGSNSYTISCGIPASVKPSCSLTVTDPTGYADTYGGYIQNVSKFKVAVTFTASYGSAVKSYKTTANGSTYASSSFTTEVLKSKGDLTVNATVTDKRGRTGSASKKLTVLEYTPPTIKKLSVKRCDEDGTDNDQGGYVQVTFSSNTTSLNEANGVTYTLGYKKSSDAAYTTIDVSSLNDTYAVTDASYIFAADTASSYDVRLVVADDFNESTKTTSASTGFTLMHWLATGFGMAIGKISELAGVLDIGFKTRFYGGILHPTLEPDTDLNDIRTPNTYVGENVSTYNYVNCPLTSGTFTLEVVGMGDDGQVKQRLTYCHKTASRAWERIYYSSGWGEWVCVSDHAGTLLWSGVYYMSASQTANLAESISKQKSGIVLVFSEYYDSEAKNQSFQERYIPKMSVAKHAGAGHSIMLTTNKFSYVGTKYLYISDTQITGHADNEATGTANGITYNNNRFVLRYVIGV